MGRRDFLIGCVGKPSAGKSTFFNAALANFDTGKMAKVAAHPFTTIEPNQGVAHVIVDCACAKLGLQRQCRPRYGLCRDGRRAVPVKLLDVAGLIPGASEGLGLGCKFLDDLRHADVLLHILDVSGTTNEKGEACVEYDPSADHEWLLKEIQLWVFNNLWSKWDTVARRQMAKKTDVVSALAAQFSGYGAAEPLVQAVMAKFAAHPKDMTAWDRELVWAVVREFVQQRFEFILVLNKADLGGATDRNVVKITASFNPDRVILASALSECLLRKCHGQRRISYVPGDMTFLTAESGGEAAAGLAKMDPVTEHRLDRVRDMVLYRFGSTGVQQAVRKAVEIARLFPVFPITHPAGSKNEAFSECLLVKEGTTVYQMAEMLFTDLGRLRTFVSAEDARGAQLARDQALTPAANVVRLITCVGDTNV